MYSENPRTMTDKVSINDHYYFNLTLFDPRLTVSTYGDYASLLIPRVLILDMNIVEMYRIFSNSLCSYMRNPQNLLSSNRDVCYQRF